MNPYFLFGGMAGRPVLPGGERHTDSARWLFVVIERLCAVAAWRRPMGLR